MHAARTHFVEVVALVVGMALASCDGDSQTVRITAQDFRFTPVTVHLTAPSPIRLTIVNEGREPHEFESSLLAHRVDRSSESSTSVRVAPNQRTDVMIRTIPGTYIFYCRIRGHASMSGTIIVD